MKSKTSKEKLIQEAFNNGESRPDCSTLLRDNEVSKEKRFSVITEVPGQLTPTIVADTPEQQQL